MTLRRAVVYVGGGSLLVAWFSSAASLSLYRGGAPSTPPGDAPGISMEAVAADVQQQASRLRKRLAAAPLPQQPARNPFAFASEAPPAREVGPVPQATSGTIVPVAAPPEPALRLIGVAEQQRPHGMIRTAMLASHDDQFFVAAAVGDTILLRFTVTAIGADSADLLDSSTGATKRLNLQ